MNIVVDESLCSACEVCSDTCPEVFEMNDEGMVSLLMNPVPEEHQEAAQEACDGCPSEAIVVADD